MSIYLGPDFLNFYLMYKPKTNIKEENVININISLFEKLENVKNDFVISKECYSDEFIKDCENSVMLSCCLTESGQDLYANNFYKLINSLPKMFLTFISTNIKLIKPELLLLCLIMMNCYYLVVINYMINISQKLHITSFC